MMERLATSLPGESPSGTVSVIPIVPAAAIRSIHGVLAACSGVLSSNSGTGKSAIPSGTRTKNFVSESEDIEYLLHFGFAGNWFGRYLDRILRIFQAVPGKGADDSGALGEVTFFALLQNTCN